ncbi:unnamed protein product [Schistosoma margrebowiei]|uniref:Uncharacterized protein n=1 Tax=Schistosoma margrebowiei TaxID=48269 RepID=A0A183MVP3_9TREM|nr:unnamed protein product [Schistosoma margrebowiei]
MLLQNRVALTPELVIGSEVVERVDRFTYLGSLISSCGLVCDEISARIQKARLAFANFRHLWRRRDIRLSTKGRVYCAAELETAFRISRRDLINAELDVALGLEFSLIPSEYEILPHYQRLYKSLNLTLPFLPVVLTTNSTIGVNSCVVTSSNINSNIHDSDNNNVNNNNVICTVNAENQPCLVFTASSNICST